MNVLGVTHCMTHSQEFNIS